MILNIDELNLESLDDVLNLNLSALDELTRLDLSLLDSNPTIKKLFAGFLLSSEDFIGVTSR
jgi:hypothetical protein